MEKLSLNEAIMVLLVERGDVDGSNVLSLYRVAQNNLITEFNVAPSGAGNWLIKQRDQDTIDEMIIWVTRNGQEDLFE